MFMADSLNTGIQKLGDTLSAKLFGNSKDNPEGSKNFSGIYIGPGGGVTRADSFTVDENRYGPSFMPAGYFDKTNQWIDDKLSSIIKELPGISRDKFPLFLTDPRSGKQTQYSKPIGPYYSIGSGFTPPGFFSPNTNLWLDQRLGLRLPTDPGGTQRTADGNFKNALEDTDGSEMLGSNINSFGFTPVVYYRTGKEIYLGSGSQAMGGFIPDSKGRNIVSTEEAKAYTKKVGDGGFYESKESSDYRFKFGLEDDNFLNTEMIGIGVDDLPISGSITPHDNEDPLFLGFEVIIDIPNSPLFNGEAAAFIDKFKSNSEVRSRSKILIDTINELSKFFKFNTTKEFTFSEEDMNNSIFGTPRGSKRHYVKKVAGLDRLIEANTPSAQAAFVKYRQDLIKLSFYEDTTLNLGTLASLYKLLYWSRLNGKNIIPENLLRFDCFIIASEVRNLVRVVKASGDRAGLETLKENVSRYVYNLYECQFFFDKMTHGDTIDIGGSSLTSPDSLEISFSYKFSTMRFDRFNHNSEKYSFLNNARNNPTERSSREANAAEITGDEIILFDNPIRNPLNNGYSGKDILSEGDNPNLGAYISQIRESNLSRSNTLSLINPDSVVLPDLKEKAKVNLYNKQYNKKVIETDTKGSNIYGNGSVNNDSENQIDLETNGGNLLKSAGDKLLQNVKKAALNEAQRQLNNQFRLVNNSLDKVRNTFGIGRMREPTNVYNNPPGGQFFFDVKNSLRDFGGDVLGGLLGG
jgi:hypothetical protein